MQSKMNTVYELSKKASDLLLNKISQNYITGSLPKKKSYRNDSECEFIRKNASFRLLQMFCFFQPIMSLCRCGPEHPQRPLFNWAHWFVGTVAYLLGGKTQKTQEFVSKF